MEKDIYSIGRQIEEDYVSLSQLDYCKQIPPPL